MGTLARCGCGGGQCNCAIAAGDNVTLSGSGSVANPYVVSATLGCEDVRPCLSGTGGVDYNPATGAISADLSGQAGNNLTLGPDGGLFVPTGAATVSVGCGLTGNGSGANPVKVATGSWPYSCSADTNGGVVVCDSSGRLRSEPRGKISYQQFFESRDYSDITVPTAQNVVADSFQMTVTNTDPCRDAFVLVEREADVYFVLPAGAGAGSGYEGDEMYYTRNTGSSSIVGAHAQTTKVLANPGLLAPGASTPVGFQVTVGRGSGGAYYYRIEVVIRAMIISL
ncbi:hypothetical protein ACFVHS_14770 [Streptomyces sp. NPDC057746]|uniref:hypothetical protein n=1 Tax=Streptomyces sp. NPDC057746 TaxID=3346237 RepID=UPI0036CA25ED